MFATLFDMADYLHHKNECVERNHDHDEILKRCRDHQAPDPVLDRVFVLGHVPAQWPRVDCKVNTLFLKWQQLLINYYKIMRRLSLFQSLTTYK